MQEFTYIEENGEADFDKVAELLRTGQVGGQVLYVIREAVSRDHCLQIQENFTAIIAKELNNRPDDGFVKTEQIGSSQFHKNGRQYMASTLECGSNVMELFDGLDSRTIRSLYRDEQLERYFAQRQITYRPALHLTTCANFATTRRWLDNGEMSLMPHEDSAQLAFAALDDFEVAGAQDVISSNICISDASQGGELMVWNLKPDAALRESFGVQDTGYPYPLDFVSRYESFSVRLAPGDLYFLNASYLHGVRSSLRNERITAGRFLASLGEKVVYWS